VQTLLAAAMAAPSACGKNPYFSKVSLVKYFFPAVSTRIVSPLAMNSGTMI
jgi:hypothetical protein